MGLGTNHLSLSLTRAPHQAPNLSCCALIAGQGVNLIQAVFCAATKFMALYAPPGKHITSEVQADREKQASQKKDKHFGNGCGIAISGTRNPFHDRCLLGIGGMVPSG